MALTLFSIQNAKPREKPYKLSDGDGLRLLVTKTSKLWRLRYRFGGKQNMLALGSFPEVPLAAARTNREDARRLVAAGIDPSQQRKADKIAAATAAANTHGALATEYLANLEANGAAATTVSKIAAAGICVVALARPRSHRERRRGLLRFRHSAL
jgi:hypothetical protein